MGQIVEVHTALTELSVNKNWIKPYSALVEQLACSYDESKVYW